jgi:type I restriction enzyme M protein|tara:strand:- start:493 stop:3066 length:2574 start_codon:yes stop_codon:yes gene_type:complete
MNTIIFQYIFDDMVSEIKIDPLLPSSIISAIDEETGKIQDIISKKWIAATPEEVNAVQVFAHRLIEDYDYLPEQIQTRPQFRVSRSPSDESKEYPVDIAVFSNDKKIESNLSIIIECKNPEKKEGLRQLKTYLDLCPADIGVWFNGKEHAYFRKVQKSGKNEYVELPNIPIRGQRIEDIGLFKRKDLKITKNLKTLFKDIRNKLSQSAVGITLDEKLAQEVMNLLFCKLYDEINTAPNEIVEFRSGFDEKPQEVKKRIKQIFENVKNEYSDIFNENEKIDLDELSINYVVGELQNYCIKDAERDALGDAFEVFIGPALKGGQGQYFTPRNVVKLAVNILDPSQSDLILDPACGSGGFLIVALEHVWEKIRKDGNKRGFDEKWIKDLQQKTASKIMHGIDKELFLTKVTKAYMAIIGDGRGGVFCENSINEIESWSEKTQNKISKNKFTVLLTNPPFGAKIPVDNKSVLEKYHLGHKWKKDLPDWFEQTKVQDQQPPQVIFIERCLEFLSPGGKMAIVLPDGVMGGSRIGYVPYFIKKNAKILAVIDCPNTTFQPHTPTKTHILFLQKKTAKELTEEKEYDIFMAVAEKIGHDAKGKQIFKKDSNIIDDDLPLIAEKFEKYRKGKLIKKDFSNLGYVISSKWITHYLYAKRYLPKFIDGLEELQELENSKNFELKSIDEIKKSLKTGANISAEEYVEESDFRYIMTDCVTEYGINADGFKYLTKKARDENITKTLEEKDIVINRAGNPGVTSIMTKDMEGVMSCGFVFVLKLKKEFDPYYVASFLNSRLGKIQTERLAFGTNLEHMTKDDLLEIKIPFPKDEKIMKNISLSYKKIVEKQEETRKGFENTNNDFEKIIT